MACPYQTIWCDQVIVNGQSTPNAVSFLSFHSFFRVFSTSLKEWRPLPLGMHGSWIPDFHHDMWGCFFAMFFFYLFEIYWNINAIQVKWMNRKSKAAHRHLFMRRAELCRSIPKLVHFIYLLLLFYNFSDLLLDSSLMNPENALDEIIGCRCSKDVIIQVF